MALELRTDGGVSLTYELFPPQAIKSKPPLTVVGDVGGKIAILVDDVIDEVQTFVDAAQATFLMKLRAADYCIEIML